MRANPFPTKSPPTASPSATMPAPARSRVAMSENTPLRRQRHRDDRVYVNSRGIENRQSCVRRLGENEGQLCSAKYERVDFVTLFHFRSNCHKRVSCLRANYTVIALVHVHF